MISTSDLFKKFLENIQVDNSENIDSKYRGITKSINKYFRDTESETNNSLRIGSYGRYTGIKGISDLDMVYIIPDSKGQKYNSPKKLLDDTKNAIKKRYSTTDIKVDGVVVVVSYHNFRIEVQPVFEEDEDFTFPDTKNGGCWRKTKPKQEMCAIKKLNDDKNGNLRLLCKMARAWRDKQGLPLSGLLIDTLAYNFMDSIDNYDNKSYSYFNLLSRDFFKFLSEEPRQDHYQAPGSNQDVQVKGYFQNKAKKSYEASKEAIESNDEFAINKWKDIYGRHFPSEKALQSNATTKTAASFNLNWIDTEEHIEDYYNININYYIDIDCIVSQNGFRNYNLSSLIKQNYPLKPNKKLSFIVIDCNIPEFFSLKWKILNRGEEAKSRNMVRGQIIDDTGSHKREERTTFRGNHTVECYAIINNEVVARAQINVPIKADT